MFTTDQRSAAVTFHICRADQANSPSALNSRYGNIFISTAVSCHSPCRCPVVGYVWGYFCQSVFLAVGAAAGTELAGGAGRVAAG